MARTCEDLPTHGRSCTCRACEDGFTPTPIERKDIMKVVNLNGRRSRVLPVLIRSSGALLVSAVVSAIALAVLLVGLGIHDIAGDEATPQPNYYKDGKTFTPVDDRGHVAIFDASGQVNYGPILLLSLIPALLGGLGAYADRRNQSGFTIRNIYIDDSFVGNFENFSTSKSYDQDDLAGVWCGGIEICAATVDALEQLRSGMNGAFVESIDSSLRVARNLQKRTADTFKYLQPAMDMTRSSTNSSLLAATELMVLDVRAVQDLVDSCGQLFVAAEISQPHTEIIQREIAQHAERIQALRSLGGNELMPGEPVSA